ncbi:type III polyketide synthase [Okibacterium endophyticum]
MAVYVRNIATVVPPTVLVQNEAKEVFATQPGLTRLGERLVRTSFDSSGIDTRRSVIDEFDLSAEVNEPMFYDRDSGALLSPGTRARNEIYIANAGPLYVEAARRVITQTEGVDESTITHVVTVSCTGFYAPGPDYEIVRELGLPSSTLRYHIGFMGCYASFPALRAALAFCRADPSAVVLVVSVELCSIHVRSSNDPDQIVAASVFGDGAAAAIVTGEHGAAAAALRIDALASDLTPVGERDMAWTIGDHGFDMVLSAAVPKIIDTYIEQAIQPVLADEPELAGDPAAGISHWAVHPGGRSILDKVESRLGLSAEQLEPSRDILRDYGNMSSATILFVLKRILDAAGSADGERVCAMAFGPGLTVETGLFTRVSARSRSQ